MKIKPDNFFRNYGQIIKDLCHVREESSRELKVLLIARLLLLRDLLAIDFSNSASLTFFAKSQINDFLK